MAKKIKKTPNQAPDENKGLTTEEIVKRHYENEDDVITDDDIKNAVINTDVPDDMLEDRFPDGTLKPKTDDKGEATTPWDILKD